MVNVVWLERADKGSFRVSEVALKDSYKFVDSTGIDSWQFNELHSLLYPVYLTLKILYFIFNQFSQFFFLLHLNTSTVYSSLHHEQAWYKVIFIDIVNFQKLYFFALLCSG